MATYVDTTSTKERNRLLSASFGWMFLGLVITAVVAFGTVGILTLGLNGANPELALSKYLWLLVGSGIFQIILIIYIQFRVFRHVGDANILVPYILYTANMGLMLSILILTYELETLGIAFGLTAGVFGIMALYARYTKRNLSGVGLVGIGLFFGSIILMLINIFMRSTQIMWIVSFVSFGAVMLITMYDVWRITKISETGVESRNLALYFALNLFVDFIYLYMRILQFVAIARSR